MKRSHDPHRVTEDAPASDAPPGQPRIVLDLVVEAGDWDAAGDVEGHLQRLAVAIASAPDLANRLTTPVTACVALADDAVVRALNAQYRSQDKPTNVLSFPAGVAPPDGEGRLFVGDIVLAAETVAAEAIERGIALADHVQHLAAHGMLHLLGFDHETEEEARVMEDLERRILASLGIDDPYREND
jgi:probable rRNA maturation factor